MSSRAPVIEVGGRVRNAWLENGPNRPDNDMPVMSIASAMKSRVVESCVEHLCMKGCKAVWKDIAVLEEGERLPETRQLSSEENRAVLRELKAIMSVYNKSGSCTTD
jgi:hypothetical protein